jgi:antitoxin HicB
MEIRYPAKIEPQENGQYLVTFIDFDDIFSEGATIEEALFNGAEALSGMLAWKLDSEVDIPIPRQHLEGVHYIAPDAKTQSAMLLRFARGERTLSDVARALETSWPAARRLEDAKHSPSLKTIERAAAALGKRLVLVLE